MGSVLKVEGLKVKVRTAGVVFYKWTLRLSGLARPILFDCRLKNEEVFNEEGRKLGRVDSEKMNE